MRVSILTTIYVMHLINLEGGGGGGGGGRNWMAGKVGEKEEGVEEWKEKGTRD